MSTSAFILIFLFVLCSRAISEIQVKEFLHGISRFSGDIFQRCSESKAGEGNMVISPFSISMGLTLLSQGTNGTTFDELRKTLYLNNNKSIVADQFYEFDKLIRKSAGEAELLISNQIYVTKGYPLKKEFEEVAVEKFSSGIESVDFGSNDTMQYINHFVEQKTKQKIKNFLKPGMIDEGTRIFLLNAIYLKSKWQYAFKRKYTYKIRFYLNETESVVVDSLFMEKAPFNFGDLEDLDARVLELTYANSNFTFLIILPAKRTGLDDLENRLKDYNLTKLFDKMTINNATIHIPKFTVETEIHLNSILKNLGVIKMFGSAADLSSFFDAEEPLYVSDVIQKAFIEINEEHTEAAIASGASARAKSGEYGFYADHPFVYYVWDKENQIPILSGHIKNFE
ncbi:leukocyte elastase inhibitor-like [Contarinia nasturtii]|uniref:leukocyte elastase inhibitor-like n=1 Tax=Contarinia nasturtii TaxID=265458 RepID=UPI0012D37DB3|nr:leukocyte elastase inhibitor-like [Contarinia nasturtii]